MVLEHSFHPAAWRSLTSVCTYPLCRRPRCQVRESDALISLPNNLTGFVEVDEVSDELNVLIEEALDVEDAEAPALSDYLWPGKSVCCVILSTATVNKKKHITVSLKPSRFNHALSLDNCHVGMSVYGAVSAVEDHGYTVAMGTNEVSAFIPLAAGKGMGRAGGVPLVGQLISAVASKVQEGQKLLVLDKDGPGEATKEVEDISLDQLQPGMLVDCRVLKVLDNGLVVMFLGSFVGTIDRFHLCMRGAVKLQGKGKGKGKESKVEDKKKRKKSGADSDDEDEGDDDEEEEGEGEEEEEMQEKDGDDDGLTLEMVFREKQKLQARIIYTDIGAKITGLSTRPHIMARTVPDFITLGIKVGRIFEDSHIARIHPGVGMMLKLPAAEAGQLEGWVHISEAADDRVEKLEKAFKVGRKVASRVVSYSWMDGMVNLTLKASVLADEVVDYGDVEIGAVLKGKVIKLDTFGCLVALSASAQGVRGLIPPVHFSDAALKAPEKRFVPGKQVTVRVLSKDEDKKRVILTCKKSLVTSPHPIVDSYDAAPGTTTHGYVAKVLPNGILVAFYGRLRAFAMLSQLGIDAEKDAVDEAFSVGQVVQCKVLSADPQGKRMKISLNMNDAVLDRKAAGTPGKEMAGALKIGRVVSVNVSGKTAHSVLVTSAEGGFAGHIPLAHLSDHTELCDALMLALEEGTQLHALVLQHERSKGVYLLTLKPSLITAAKADELPSRISDVSPQQFVQGYVSATADFGVFVNFLGGMSALAPKANLMDSFVSSVADEYTVGQSVRCCVISADAKDKKVTVTLKPSLCMCPDDSFLSSLLAQTALAASLKAAKKTPKKNKTTKGGELKPGSVVVATVDEVKDYGAVLSLPDGATGFAPNGHFPEGLKKGALHEVVCLDVDPLRDIVTVSLDKRLVGSAKVAPKKRAAVVAEINPSDTVSCVVQCLLPGRVVLTLPEHGHALAVSASEDYNLRGAKAEARFEVGKTVTAVVFGTGGQRISVGCGADLGQSRGKGKERKDTKEKKVAKGVDLAAIGGGIVSVDDAKVGGKLGCIVSGTTSSHLLVRLGLTVKGQVHITDVFDAEASSKEDPLKGFKSGQVVEGVVLGVRRTVGGSNGKKAHEVVELSLRPSLLSLKKGGKLPTRTSLASMAIGDVLTCYVDEVKKDSVWVHVASGLRGKIFALDASDDLAVIKALGAKFKPRTPLLCRVIAKNEEDKTLDLSTRMAEEAGKTPKKRKGVSDKNAEFAPGMVVAAKVTKITPGLSLLLQLGAHTVGRVNICDVNDSPEEEPLKAYKVGQYLRTAVLGVDGDKIDLSLRGSRTGAVVGAEAGAKVGKKRASEEDKDEIVGEMRMPEVNEAKELSPGQLICGYVKSTSSSGCFVMLSRTVTARVGISQLSDRFIQDVKGSFAPGKLVHGRILSVDAAKGLVDMSLKSSVVLAKKRVLYSDLEVGQIVKGHVKRVQAFGIFVRLNNSDLDGLCHISEVTTDYVKDLGKLYSAGDKVKAKIIKLDKTKKTISLGMKESHFEGVEEVEDEDDSDEEGEGREDKDLVAGISDSEEEEDEDDEDDDDAMDENDDEDDEEDEEDAASKGGARAALGMDGDSGEDDDDDDGDDEKEGGKSRARAGFEWEGFGSKTAGAEESADESEEDDEGEEAGESAASKSREKRRKKREKEREEALTLEKEEALLDPERAPETAEEFERLVVTSPNRCLSPFAFRLSPFPHKRAPAATPVAETVARLFCSYLGITSSLCCTPFCLRA